jgi:FtsP/CotA-like multicopper oxidase with cupredoxin domain
MDTISQTVKLGDTEAWSVTNGKIFPHSFHIHDVQFSMVSRSTGPVADYEKGWKDTFSIVKGEKVTFVAKFEDYASNDHPFMYHCHMSNHEDEGLMGQFLVVE